MSRGTPWTDEDWETALDMLNKGEPAWKIALELKRSKNAVRTMLGRAGFSIKKKNPIWHEPASIEDISETTSSPLQRILLNQAKLQAEASK